MTQYLRVNNSVKGSNPHILQNKTATLIYKYVSFYINVIQDFYLSDVYDILT